MDLSTTSTTVAGTPVLVLAGEVDLASLPVLHSALLRLVAHEPATTVAVDLDGIVALDDAGMGLLLGAAARARSAGGDLVVVCNDGRLRERFALSGLDRAVEVRHRLSPGS